MQGLYEGSDEDAEVAGLGVFPGRVRRFPRDARVPHMGWNLIDRRVGDSPLLAALPKRPFVYFANSYFAPVQAETVAVCDYHGAFAAALQRDNVWGVQFHPEKSGVLGLQVMRNFAAC
jgi:imidazole glycerol phosphate synthase glutamine amidotransferase subunit